MEKTPLQQLRKKIFDEKYKIEKRFGHNQASPKMLLLVGCSHAALDTVIEWIDKEFIPSERDAIVDAAMFVPDARTIEENRNSGEQYYETRYGK